MTGFIGATPGHKVEDKFKENTLVHTSSNQYQLKREIVTIKYLCKAI
mgnify:CR=1 FL=1